ncbi:hypothetical protein KIN20_025418 [Parelaphostrongylus tenuis]|uniref:NR LBD domain-containing protein n=1 Tax=Parelaphostrongylus tenuis TaxID=148309 RepID=A0AAD5QWX6_PARTN|nr:hypothetical protein KIN20_025418 [Parelaphostrongylus tenuis]
MFELEASYWTYRILPEQQRDKMMLTLTTYSDLKNLECLICGADEPQDIYCIKQVITSLQMHLRATLPIQMHRIVLSEVEFMAILTLTLWSSNHGMTLTPAAMLTNRHRRLSRNKETNGICAAVRTTSED